jgi:hypothetical protein
MNINGDYLWDKTGEPDTEIREVEEILGTLRYQPRPLEIPVDLQTPRRSFFSVLAPRLLPRLAMAATIAAILVGLGLWLGLQRLRQPPAPPLAKTTNAPAASGNPSPTAVPTPNENGNSTVAGTSSQPEQKQTDRPRRHRVNQSLIAGNVNRARHETHKGFAKDQLAANELREGEAAKDQLMLALRVASAKLSFAQRKTQNINPRDPVHNQHKIG